MFLPPPCVYPPQYRCSAFKRTPPPCPQYWNFYPRTPPPPCFYHKFLGPGRPRGPVILLDHFFSVPPGRAPVLLLRGDLVFFASICPFFFFGVVGWERVCLPEPKRSCRPVFVISSRLQSHDNAVYCDFSGETHRMTSSPVQGLPPFFFPSNCRFFPPFPRMVLFGRSKRPSPKTRNVQPSGPPDGRTSPRFPFPVLRFPQWVVLTQEGAFSFPPPEFCSGVVIQPSFLQ